MVVTFLLPVAPGCSGKTTNESADVPEICEPGALPCAADPTSPVPAFIVRPHLEVLCRPELRELAKRAGCPSIYTRTRECIEERPPFCEGEMAVVAEQCTLLHLELSQCLFQDPVIRCEASKTACERCACEACPCTGECVEQYNISQECERICREDRADRVPSETEPSSEACQSCGSVERPDLDAYYDCYISRILESGCEPECEL